MNPEQLPSVSTLRVEKPGKSKFAPSIGGRKAAPTASMPSNAPAPLEPVEIVVEEEIVNEGAQGLAEDMESESISSNVATTGKRIESVASRRQAHEAVKIKTAQSHEVEIRLPEGPKNAATLSTSSASDSKPLAEKRTMAYFLKDTGEGREMPDFASSASSGTSSVDSSSGGKSPQRSRKIVNLKNIKAPRSTSTALAPQVRVINGEIVYDEGTAAAVSMPGLTDDLEQQLEYVEDDENGRHLTSATYAKRSGSNRWNSNETALFYETLSMCGTDFSMIQTLFPHRTRAQIKGKFKLEERSDFNRVHSALKARRPFDPNFKDRVDAAIKPRAAGN